MRNRHGKFSMFCEPDSVLKGLGQRVATALDNSYATLIVGGYQ